MYSRNTKTTNEPTASINKSDRPQVNIWDNWKTLKYLNINGSIHLKDLEIFKYKRESKARMPIKKYVYFLSIVAYLVFWTLSVFSILAGTICKQTLHETCYLIYCVKWQGSWYKKLHDTSIAILALPCNRVFTLRKMSWECRGLLTTDIVRHNKYFNNNQSIYRDSFWFLYTTRNVKKKQIHRLHVLHICT
jgi:hypothetical protein